MKNIIHQSDAERLQHTSQDMSGELSKHSQKMDKTNETLQNIHEAIKDKSLNTAGFVAVNDSLEELKDIASDKNIVRKLEEVKSASLISNKLLKDISKKEMPDFPLPKDFPTEMSIEIKGAELVTIKGKPGDDGYTPQKGVDYYTPEEVARIKKEITPKKNKDYFDGDDGYTPQKGKDYFTEEEIKGFKKEITPKKGKDYKDGKPGYTPQKGVDYYDGKDGSPDTAEQIIEKINLSQKLIEPHRINGLLNVMHEVSQYGTNPQGGLQNVGGANPLIILSNGTRVTEYFTELNIGSGITASYAGNGRVTLTGSGSSTTYSETPSGAINGSNKVYTVLNSITTVINFSVNGQFIHPAEYSVVTTTITFVTALDSSLSGKGFTIIYS